MTHHNEVEASHRLSTPPHGHTQIVALNLATTDGMLPVVDFSGLDFSGLQAAANFVEPVVSLPVMPRYASLWDDEPIIELLPEIPPATLPDLWDEPALLSNSAIAEEQVSYSATQFDTVDADIPSAYTQDNLTLEPDNLWDDPAVFDDTPQAMPSMYFDPFDDLAFAIPFATEPHNDASPELLLDALDLSDLAAELEFITFAIEAPHFAPNKTQPRAGWRGSNSLLLVDRTDTAFAEAEAIRRLGYANIPISAETRAFINQAFNAHTLNRKQEVQHTRQLAALYATLAALPPDTSQERAACEDEIAHIEHILTCDLQWLAIRVALSYRNRGLELDDLMQHGMIGIVTAIRKFDPSRNVRLITYAQTWVHQAMSRAVGYEARAIRLPIHVGEKLRYVRKTHAAFVTENGRLPTRAELAAAADIEGEKLKLILNRVTRPLSFERLARAEYLSDSDGDWGASANLIETEDETIEPAEAQMLKADIADMLSSFTERDRRIMELRFGLDGSTPHTLEEVGQVFNLTRERIRQIEAKVLKRMRHPSKARRLKEYVNFCLTTLSSEAEAQPKAKKVQEKQLPLSSKRISLFPHTSVVQTTAKPLPVAYSVSQPPHIVIYPKLALPKPPAPSIPFYPTSPKNDVSAITHEIYGPQLKLVKTHEVHHVPTPKGERPIDPRTGVRRPLGWIPTR